MAPPGLIPTSLLNCPMVECIGLIIRDRFEFGNRGTKVIHRRGRVFGFAVGEVACCWKRVEHFRYSFPVSMKHAIRFSAVGQENPLP